jgi:hypothetical protein
MMYWPALLFRGAAGGGIYWLSFYPAVLSVFAHLFGWSGSIPSLPQIAPVALFAGISSDVVLDYVASKIPVFKGELPSFTEGVKKTEVVKTTVSQTTTTPLIDATPVPEKTESKIVTSEKV